MLADHERPIVQGACVHVGIYHYTRLLTTTAQMLPCWYAYGGGGGAVYGHGGSTPSDAWHRHVHIHGEVGIAAAVHGKSQWPSRRALLARR